MKTKFRDVKKNLYLGLLVILTVISIGRFDAVKGAAKDKYIVFIGTYSKGGSKGIYGYRFDAFGQPTSLGLLAETENPTFLTVDSSGHFLYTVNGVDEYKGVKGGAITAFAIDHASGKLTALNEVSSRGLDPCYIALDKTGRYVLVANYGGGNVAVFPIEKDGKLGEASGLAQGSGSGPNKDRQEGPHPHWLETTPDNRYAIAVDLGIDKLMVYKFDAAHGSLTPNDPPFVKVEAGQGPRHVVFHPNGKFVYVVNELGSTVTGFSYDAAKGILQTQQTISTLPTGFSGANTTAEIHVHPNGKFLFASNRGHDSIAVFSIDQSNGHLSLLDTFSTQGKNPRDFEIDPSGKFLFAANQDSGNVMIFRIDQNTGRLTPTGQELKVAFPVCVKFLAID